jgi:hypothetical protein
MIREDRLQNALWALHTVLVIARHMAASGTRSVDLAEVLDVAEYLPGLIAASEDNTQEYRSQLELLSDRYPDTSIALERFDRVPVPRW